jgi:ribonuclease R
VKSHPLRDRILQLLRAPNYRPLDQIEMSKALRWPGEKRVEFRGVLDALERDGEIARIRKDRYILPETADLITGTLQVHLNGNAHLINEKKGQPDLFIGEPNMGTAMNGDKVVARLMHEGREQRRASDKLEGRVIRILERVNDTVVGTLQRSKQSFFYVIPDDPRLQHDVYVQAGAAHIGDKVVVKLEAWESRHVNPEGRIVEVLGPAHAPGIDMLSIIRKYQLAETFPDEVLREAERISETVPPEEIARREDIRHMPVVTIDPDDAKDFDDAIHVERTAGGWRLGVHIADVSHYVQPGTALDTEARKRGNSTYLADRVVPMLPERLSNGICSLKGGVDRLTFSAFIDFDAQGKICSARFARTVIRSAARMTYRQAFAILKDEPVPPTPNHERGGKVHLAAAPVPLNVTPKLRERVHVAWELASLLRKNRFAAGSLDLDFPEVKVWLDDEGRADRLERVENDISHQLIEECMLAANEVVARELKNRNVPVVYRVHEDPDPTRLADFREFAASYGFKAGDLTQRREVQKLLASTKGKPEEYAIRIQLLKSLKRAVYGTTPLGHYGLAKVNYTHFTSPIRRYADLAVHRSLATLQGAGAPSPRVEKHGAGAPQLLGELAEHISKTERTSADAERDSTTLKKMEFFQRQLDARRPDEFRAIVVDVRSYGLLIELPDVLLTGMIHVSALPGDFFQFDSARLSFVGRKTRQVYKTGDVLQVIVCRVDAYKRQVDFVPVGDSAPAASKRRPASADAKPRTSPAAQEKTGSRGRRQRR